MKGIKLSHGVIFVTDGTHTVRLLKDGTCGVSPILYETLEWDLRTERPETYEYLTSGDIVNLPDNGYEKIKQTFEEIYKILKGNVQ